MKCFHIFPAVSFKKDFVDFINCHFSGQNHLFWVVEKKFFSEHTIFKNDEKIAIRNVVTLVKEMNKCDKIFLHGLFNTSILLLLWAQPWVLKKTYWCIWGSDLYRYRTGNTSLKNRLIEALRRCVIKKIGNLVTHVKGDCELAKIHYNNSGNYHYCFMYSSNTYRKMKMTNKSHGNGRITIQVGNSADPSNNHVEVFEKLISFRDSIDVICPLSYGDAHYREYILIKGKEIFGDRFKPITEFLPIEEYRSLLERIDVAIFNHDRQQAIGNITALLGYGKKVYIREETTTWQFCIDHDLNVYSANCKYDDLLESIDREIAQKNIENVALRFSEKKLLIDLNNIFEH